MEKKIILFILYFFLIFVEIFFVRQSHSEIMVEEEQLIRIGVGAFKDGLYDISEKQFSHFINDYPNHGKIYDIYYLLGKTYLIKGKLKEARAIFLKIFNENKDYEFLNYTFFWLANIEMRLGNDEEAKKYFLLLHKKSPKFEWIAYSYYLLGIIDLGLNQLNQAESSFKKASQLSKNNESIRPSFFWLGILSYKKNSFENAITYFLTLGEDQKWVPQEYLKYTLFWLAEAQMRLGKYQDAKLNYKRFYEQYHTDPFIPEIYWRLGYCEYQLGNIKDSISIFESFKNIFKDSSLILYTHYLLGEILLIHGDHLSSIKEMNFILNHPQGIRLWGVACLTLFWNYVQLGERESANRTLQKLQKLDHAEDEKVLIQWLNAEIIFFEGRIPDALPYYFNVINTRLREKALFKIGKGYFFENKFREALTNLDILILEFPNSTFTPECLLMKGECLVKLGHLDQALETGNLLANQNRNNLWQLLALTQVGSIALSLHQNEIAEIAFKKVTETFPDHPLYDHAAFQLGNLYLMRKNMVEAISFYSIIIKRNALELFGQASFNLGEIYIQQGKYEKALATFETAIRHLKENSSGFFLAQLEIGNLQRILGKYEEAKGAYRIILDQSKDEEIKNAAKDLLNYI